MLDDTVCARRRRAGTFVFLLDKNKKDLLAIAGTNIPKYLTFTYSNPACWW
jgi:hypothetical protein